MPHPGHPPVLASVIIVRNRPFPQRGSTISHIALFTVTRCGRRAARFSVSKAAFDPTTPRAAVIDGLCERIPPGAEVLVREPGLPDHAYRRIVTADDIMPPCDNTLIVRRLPGSTLLPLVVSDRQLAEMGRSIGLDLPRPQSTPLRRSRSAPEQAMALWAAYTAGFCSRREAECLFAAFRAWRAIEQARPVPF